MMPKGGMARLRIYIVRFYSERVDTPMGFNLKFETTAASSSVLVCMTQATQSTAKTWACSTIGAMLVRLIGHMTKDKYAATWLCMIMFQNLERGSSLSSPSRTI